MLEPDVKETFALRFAHLPSWVRFSSAVFIGAGSWFVWPPSWSNEVTFVASWDVFAIVAITFVWYTMLALGPEHIQHVARIEDPSRSATLGIVVVSAPVPLVAVIVLLQNNVAHPIRMSAITLALSAVVLTWLLIHTVFTLRYAHIYHGDGEGEKGLVFPGNEECPEYSDFAYFSFVIGMTAQTSDVAVSHNRMRKIVLLHGLVSFAFNTAVVALTIGVLTTLI